MGNSKQRAEKKAERARADERYKEGVRAAEEKAEAKKRGKKEEANAVKAEKAKANAVKAEARRVKDAEEAERVAAEDEVKRVAAEAEAQRRRDDPVYALQATAKQSKQEREVCTLFLALGGDGGGYHEFEDYALSHTVLDLKTQVARVVWGGLCPHAPRTLRLVLHPPCTRHDLEGKVCACDNEGKVVVLGDGASGDCERLNNKAQYDVFANIATARISLL